MRSFQAAHDAVAAGGEIVVLDTAGYGTIKINKSVAVVVPPGVSGFVTSSSGSPAIEIYAGANDSVTLRGLIVEGPGRSGTAIGIFATVFGRLVIEDTTVRNFDRGISLFGSTTPRLVVRGGAIRDTNLGVQVIAAGSSLPMAVVSETELTGNGTAFAVTSSSASARAFLTATRCLATDNSTVFDVSGVGVAAFVEGCTITAAGMVFRTTSATIYTGLTNRIVGYQTRGPATALALE